MAGTGHSYEISNPAELLAFSGRWLTEANREGLEQACTWFRSRHFARFISGRRFTYALTPSLLLDSRDPAEKNQFIMAKVLAGQDVRRFSPELFEQLGPNLSHALEWIRWLRRSSPGDYGKIGRMATDVIIAKAEGWTERLNARASGEEGKTEFVLDTGDGLSWYELKDGVALAREGSLMSHCVGGEAYAEAVRIGSRRIFSLRKEGHHPVLTLDVADSTALLSLVQVESRANRGLPVGLAGHAAALLNHIGAVGRGVQSGLVYEGGTWGCVHDRWNRCEIAGRQALTDGVKVMFMCTTDRSKPLFVLSPVGSIRNWFADGMSSKHGLTVLYADGRDPAYKDQAEAADICNGLLASGHPMQSTVSWLALRDGTYMPAVDALEKVPFGDDDFYYSQQRDDYLAYFLPHSEDRARLLVGAGTRNGRVYAEVVAGERIPATQVERVVSFLNAVKAVDTEDSSGETRRFLSEYGVIRSLTLKEWKWFDRDKTTFPSTVEGAVWEMSAYMLLLRTPRATPSRFDLDGKRLEYFQCWRPGRPEIREMSRVFRKLGLERDCPMHFGGIYNGADDAALFRAGGKWLWYDDAKTLRALVGRALSGDPSLQSAPILDGLLVEVRRRLARLSEGKQGAKGKRAADWLRDARRDLLARWIDSDPDFGLCPPRRARSMGGWDAPRYCLIDRLCDLYDDGYRPMTPKAERRLKKAFTVVAEAFKYRTKTIWGDDDLADLAVRWHPMMPVKLLNKVSDYWLRSSFLTASKLTELLDGEDVWKAPKFGFALLRTGEHLLGDVELGDRNAVLDAARLAAAVARRSYLFSWYVEKFDRILEAAKTMGLDPGELHPGFEAARLRLAKNAAPSRSAA